MLDRLAVPKIIYVRPVGSPENTSNIGENPNPRTFCPKIIYGIFSALTLTQSSLSGDPFSMEVTPNLLRTTKNILNKNFPSKWQ